MTPASFWVEASLGAAMTVCLMIKAWVTLMMCVAYVTRCHQVVVSHQMPDYNKKQIQEVTQIREVTQRDTDSGSEPG